VKKKGFEYLIDAAAALKVQQPRLRVAIAGSGDLETSLRARAQAAGVGDNVQFLGVVAHDVVPLLLAAADVAVAPSVHDDEGNVDGLPNTVMEMMASGTPLVATPAGGIGAMATHGVTALIVPERDVPALASAIESLLRDRSAAMLIGTQARDHVSRHHSWARVAEDFEAVYQRC
jgi:glycosyltransferase involved in cell wall biosynthesis